MPGRVRRSGRAGPVLWRVGGVGVAASGPGAFSGCEGLELGVVAALLH